MGKEGAKQVAAAVYEGLTMFDLIGASNSSRFFLAVSSDASISDYYGDMNSYLDTNYGPWTDGIIGGLSLFGVASGGGTSLIGSIRIPIYRQFGGASRASGLYWSLINPRLYGKHFQYFAGIGSWNSGAFQVKASVELRNVIKIKPAAPIPGRFGRLVPEIQAHPLDARLIRYNGFQIK